MRQTRPVAVLILLASLPLANAQTQPEQYVPHLKLKVKEKLPVSSSVSDLGGIHFRCDGKGNVYYRPGDATSSGPIVRVSADGRNVTTIDLKSLPDFGGSDRIIAWTNGLRGEIHLIAYNNEGKPCLLTFDDAGQVKSSGKLDSEFIFLHLAVFPTGELLAAGLEEHKEKNETLGEPYTAIFDRNGTPLKELNFSGDVKDHSMKEGSNESRLGPVIALGDEVPADDGNIYVMRKAEKHPIFVISPAGEVVRKLNLVPPREGWDWYDFFVAGGKLVIEAFKPNSGGQKSSDILYSLYDTESGERQLDYEITPEISGPLVCYVPNQFTFLTVQDNGLSITHAVPR